MLTALALALVLRVSPQQPSVGELITIDAGKGPLVLQKASDYEVVSQSGGRVVVRTFAPKAFTVTGTAGGEAFRQVIPVRSVLKPKDDLVPAPLAPPVVEPERRLPWVLIMVAGLVAAAVWTWLAYHGRRERAEKVVLPLLTPVQRYRVAIEALRASPRTPKRWERLADALRDYLAATEELSFDLTTTELLARERHPVVAEVLHQGDYEKFSPWGAQALDFDDMARRALELAIEQDQEAAA
jgi:hypothetical protein